MYSLICLCVESFYILTTGDLMEVLYCYYMDSKFEGYLCDYFIIEHQCDLDTLRNNLSGLSVSNKTDYFKENILYTHPVGDIRDYVPQLDKPLFDVFLKNLDSKSNFVCDFIDITKNSLTYKPNPKLTKCPTCKRHGFVVQVSGGSFRCSKCWD